VLQKICSARKVIPDTYDVSRTLSVSDGHPFAHGGSCDAYKGSLRLREDVFVKKLRVNEKYELERFKEVSHSHVLLLGLLLTDQLKAALRGGYPVEAP
jgi:hypothetical protein